MFRNISNNGLSLHILNINVNNYKICMFKWTMFQKSNIFFSYIIYAQKFFYKFCYELQINPFIFWNYKKFYLIYQI